VFGLTGLERLDKIECWPAQGDGGGTGGDGTWRRDRSARQPAAFPDAPATLL